MENDRVTFRYRASDTGQSRCCSLAVEEFIHRFLQHVLPKGFVKVRYYGFLSVVGQRTQLTTLRQQLAPVVANSLFAQPPCATDKSTPRADSFITTVTPLATTVPSVAPLAPPTPSDIAAISVAPSASETPDQQALTTNPPSMASTPQREVRCPTCGRLLLRRSILFPTYGHPP
jgi:hypothetical protein